MSTDESSSVPAGAAVLPAIPDELGIQPWLLAVLHASVFLNGSDEDIVHPRAAEETLDFMLAYLGRLSESDRQRLQFDVETLVSYGKTEKWGKAELKFLKDFLASCLASGKPEK